MKRPILIHPDPRLKKVCDPVSDVSDELRALADDMLALYHGRWKGSVEPVFEDYQY